MGQILILSLSTDPSTNLVVDHLNRLGADWVRINVDRLAEDVRCTWSSGPDGPDAMVALHSLGQTCTTQSVATVWYRRSLAIPHLPTPISRNEEAFLRREITHFWRGVCTAIKTDRWVNDWRSGLTTKPEQLAAARRAGLLTPPTLISNDPCRVREFIEGHGPQIVVKPVANGTIGEAYEGFSAPKRLKPEDRPNICFTECISLEDVQDDQAITTCPAIYQAFIRKDQELRITVVGEQVFSVAMKTMQRSDAQIDWRRIGNDLLNVPHEVHHPPQEVEHAILTMMDELNLKFGALDMILTPDGEYVFLEVNPFGQWGWTEHLTQLPISRSLAELLCSLSVTDHQ